MNVLVCDDERQIVDSIIETLEKKTEETQVSSRFYGFSQPSQIDLSLPYDIALLDIDMGETNGIELARKLRAENENIVIIFITNFIQYAPEGFEVQAFRYLLKADLSAKLDSYFDSAVQEVLRRKQLVTISINSEIIDVSFFDVAIPTEAEQIESIDQAESEKSPSAFVLSQAEIENALRRGSNVEGCKLRIWKIYQLQPDRKLRAKALANEYAPYGPGGSSHTYLDGSSGWLDHDSKGLTFEHYPDHQKVLLRWDRVEKYIDLMIQSDRYLSDKERRAIDFPLELNAASAAEYTALKAQHPDTLVGFEAGGNFMFYGEDAVKVSKIINGILLTEKTALGEVKVSGFSPSLWARKSKELWSAGNNVYLAGLSENGTHHQTKYLRKEDYLPIGSVINMDGREFRVDGVDFDKGKVSLQDMALADVRMPIFREESLSLVRELYEQQDEALDAAPEKAVDYKVGDSVVVDLPTKTIEGTIGYVGETDVRIDTSAQGYSWSNEVLNKQQFEDGLRQDEPTPDEKLDKLPISVEINGEWQTFPDAAAADEALNVEPVPEAAGNFRITDDHLGEGGAKQKYARNIEAIRTLFQLEQEHRGATAEEQQSL